MKNKHTHQFLSKLDRWLLKNQPLIWRSRIHYVLFFSLLTIGVVFSSYHLYTMTTFNMPDSNMLDNFQNAMIITGCFALLVWGFIARKRQIRSNLFNSFLVTGVLYWIGMVVICSTVWVASKAMDVKVAGLLTEESITTYYKIFYSESEKRRELNRNGMTNSQRWKVDKEFYDTYGMPYRKFVNFREKVSIVKIAKTKDDWFGIDLTLILILSIVSGIFVKFISYHYYTKNIRPQLAY